MSSIQNLDENENVSIQQQTSESIELTNVSEDQSPPSSRCSRFISASIGGIKARLLSMRTWLGSAFFQPTAVAIAPCIELILSPAALPFLLVYTLLLVDGMASILLAKSLFDSHPAVFLA